MRYKFIIAGVLGILASPALADWQYTRWGMTELEVISASDQTIIPEQNPKMNKRSLKSRLHGTHFGGGVSTRFEFDSYFLFDFSDKLQEVHLELKNGKDCADLAGAIMGIYGPTQADERSPVYSLRKWWDKSNQNLISLFQIGEKCTLSYAAIIKPGTRGL